MKRSLLAVAAAIGILSGCGGGGGASGSQGSPGSPIVVPQTTKVAFDVKIPVSTGSSSASIRKPSYVSTDTKSVTFEVSTNGGTTYGGPQSVNIDITNVTQCPQSGGYYNCQAYFDAPIGTITLRVRAWSLANGAGNVLSEAIVASQTIVEGQDNAVAVTLDGVVATLALSLSPTSISAGTSSGFTAQVTGYDGAGDAILVPPGKLVDSTGAALSPTLTAGTYATAFSIGTYDSSANTFAVTYGGSTPIAGPITFTLAETGYTSATADLTVNPLPALSVSTSALQFTNVTATKNVTITESGYGSGDFDITTSSGCAGVITVPSSVTAASGSATLTVTPVAVGGVSPACTITVTDSHAQTKGITATVTQTHGVIQ